jgi:hypothetical protein
MEIKEGFSGEPKVFFIILTMIFNRTKHQKIKKLKNIYIYILERERERERERNKCT